MKGCLKNRRLWLVHQGEEASASDRSHVAGCLPCAERYRRLTRDLGTLRAVLLRPPPAETRAARRASWQTAALTAGLAGVAVLGGVHAFRWHAAAPSAVRPASQAETRTFLQQVAATLTTESAAGPSMNELATPFLEEVWATLASSRDAGLDLGLPEGD